MTLREKIADEVKTYQWDSAFADDEADQIADAILAIPEIADALRQAYGEGELTDYLRRMDPKLNLGPSISTGTRRDD